MGPTLQKNRLLMILVMEDVDNENQNDARPAGIIKQNFCSHLRWPPV